MGKQTTFAFLFSVLVALLFLTQSTISVSEKHNVTVALVSSSLSPSAGPDYVLSAMPESTVTGIVISGEPNSITGDGAQLSSNYDEGKKAYLAYTRGSATDIEKRIKLVRNGIFETAYNPSFGFPIAGKNTVEIGLSYDNIDFFQEEILHPGMHRLLIHNDGSAQGKRRLLVRKE